MKLLKEKLPTPHLVTLLLITLWIALWNAVALALSATLETLPFSSWSFFISVTFFFFFEEGSYSHRFWSVLIGGAVGIIFTWLLVIVDTALIGLGMGPVLAAMIPLTVILLLLILGKPLCPVVFNSVGFAYFIIAFIQLDKVVEKTPAYLLSLLMGCIILCLGCVGIINLTGKLYAKKK